MSFSQACPTCQARKWCKGALNSWRSVKGSSLKGLGPESFLTVQ